MSEKIEVKCGLTNLMRQAAEEMRTPGVTIGFVVAEDYLIRIAKRALELKDETLIYLCKQLCLIVEKEEK